MATEIQTLQPKTQLDITQKQGGWLNAMIEQATTPNALASFGVQMAENASQTYQQLRGIEAGKQPNENLLPPITKADKAFVDGYSAQAQQTLGLQAQQFINKAQLDLNKNYQLSNSQIQTYQQNVSKGLQQIIDQAPYTIKADLTNQYQSALQNQVFQLNNKLLSQQKSNAKEQAGLYIKSQLSQMTDAAMTGHGNTKSIYDNSQKYINNKQASGMWSPAEAEAQRQAVKQLYLNNALAQQAVSAYQDKKLEPFLNSLTNVPTKFDDLDVSYNEWESARTHALNSIVNYERFTSSEQNLLVSDAKIKFAEGALDQTQINDLKQQLQPQKFNELYGYILNQQNKNLNKQQKITELLANNTNIDVMSRATPKEVDATYDATVTQIKANANNLGKQVSDADAQFQAINTIPRPIPAVNNAFAGKLLNGDALSAIEAASQIRRIEDSGLSGRLDARFTSQSGSAGQLAHAINTLLPYSQTPEEAVSMARQLVFQNEEQKNASLALSQKFQQGHGTAEKKTRFAKNLVDVPDKDTIVDKSAFYLSVADAYADALKIFGNENMAKTWVQKGIDQNYGTTYVNGQPQFTFMPIEKLINLGENSAPMIQEDIHRDASRYVDNMKAIYDSNENLGFYYELENRISYDEFAKAQLTPNDKNSKQITKDFLSAKPIKITKVYRDTGERIDYTLEVKSGPFASIGAREDLLASGYDFVLRNKDGSLESFYGTFGTNGRIPFYMPDAEYIKNGVMSYQQAAQKSYQQRLQDYLVSSLPMQDRFKSLAIPPLERLGFAQKSKNQETEILSQIEGK
jgi:hypothetical protein